MHPNRFPLVMTVAVATLLSACGGGGGGSTPTTAAPSTAIAQLAAPANFGFANFKQMSLSASALFTGVGGFAVTDVQRTYVSIWYLDGTGAHQQLAFLSVASAQALGSAGIALQLPADVGRVRYEIYDANQSKSGEVQV